MWKSNLSYLKQLQSNTVLILGFTHRTGLSAARFFQSQKVPYYIYDKISKEDLLRQNPELNPLGTYWGELENLPLKFRDKRFIGLLSPGFPRKIAEKQLKGMSLYYDYDLIYPFFQQTKVIAISGTDGKTTTSQLIYHLLNENYSKKKKIFLGGNVGIPIFNLLKTEHADVVILELSSYMLEHFCYFKSDIAILTNIAKDHLDRYNDYHHYIETKLKLLDQLKEDGIFIFNTYQKEFIPLIKAKIKNKNITTCDFSLDEKETKEIRTDFSIRINKTTGKPEEFYLKKTKTNQIIFCQNIPIDIKWISLKHNRLNALASIAVFYFYLNKIKPSSKLNSLTYHPSKNSLKLITKLSSFKGLTHRMERVVTKKNITVYNDSKATTVQAVEMAIANIKKGLVLIMGGKGKNMDFSPIFNKLPLDTKLFFYGEDRNLLLEQYQQMVRKKKSVFYLYTPVGHYNFKNIINLAWRTTTIGDCLLLSPGCTSWDQHSSYEERGEQFKKIIKRLDIY